MSGEVKGIGEAGSRAFSLLPLTERGLGASL